MHVENRDTNMTYFISVVIVDLIILQDGVDWGTMV